MPFFNRAQEERPARRGMRFKTKVILLLFLLAALALSFLLGGLLLQREAPAPVITSELLGQQLSTIQELATVEYHYTNMGKFENQVDFYGWKVPFTTKSFIVAYDGVIKAGIDLSGVDCKVSGDHITVTLPRAAILSHEIDEDSLEIFDETRNIFNPIQISDYTAFTADQKDSVEAKAIENGLLTAADERAAAAVRQLIAALPGASGYSVTVK